MRAIRRACLTKMLQGAHFLARWRAGARRVDTLSHPRLWTRPPLANETANEGNALWFPETRSCPQRPLQLAVYLEFDVRCVRVVFEKGLKGLWTVCECSEEPRTALSSFELSHVRKSDLPRPRATTERRVLEISRLRRGSEGGVDARRARRHESALHDRVFASVSCLRFISLI